MRILFSDTTFAYLYPGGKINMVLLLKQELENLGHEVIFENWWESNIDFDVVHFFGYYDVSRILALKKRKVKVVYTHIIDEMANLPFIFQLKYRIQRMLLCKLLPGKMLYKFFPHYAINIFDEVVYITNADKIAGEYIFGIDSKKISIIGHGYYFESEKIGYKKNELYSDAFICVGTIVPRKRQIELARLATKAGIKVLFIGHNYQDEYFEEFSELFGEYVVYLGRLDDDCKNELLFNCKGFVLLSRSESGCIAIYEASEFGLPIILPKLPWARSYQEPQNLYFVDDIVNPDEFSKIAATSSKCTGHSFKMHTWREVASQYLELYMKNI